METISEKENVITITEKRELIFEGIVVMAIMSILICGFAYTILTYNYTDSLQDKVLLVYWGLAILSAFGAILTISTLILSIVHFIFPVKIELTSIGIKCSNKKIIKWDEVENIDYLKIEKVYKNIFHSIVFFISLFFVISPILWITYIARAYLLLDSFKSDAVCIKLKNNKQQLLGFNKSFYGDDFIEIIKGYKKLSKKGSQRSL